MSAPLVSTVACVLLLAGLLAAERVGSRRGRYVTKPLASLGFILVCVLGADLGDRYSQLILLGLVLGAAGDVALMFDHERAFLAGLGSFLLGHLAYVVAFAQVQPIGEWPLEVVPLPLLGALVAGRWLWPHLGSMKVPVVLYIAVITTMAIGSLALVINDSPPALTRDHALLATAGALAFFASDLAVARETFVSKSFVNRAWGLPAYYGGQLLLAWSTIG